jgi:4-hydroxy-tetrahydrodipicolinate synthase
MGMNAGCQAWYSVIGGLFPKTALAITRAAQAGHADEAIRLSDRLSPLWTLFHQCGGSLRVIAAAAEILRLAPPSCLPLPMQSLHGDMRERLVSTLDELQLS